MIHLTKNDDSEMNQNSSRFALLFGFILLAFFAGCESQTKSGEIQRLDAPVINGTIDLGDRYPSVVRVLSDVGSCTGTLIHDRYVLTAAHCVCLPRSTSSDSFDSIADASNCVATVDVQTWTNQKDGKRIVADVTAHPDYRQTFTSEGFIVSSTSDVAVLELRGCVSQDIEPSDLAVASLETTFRGDIVQAGFGAIDCNETPSVERRFGVNSVRSITGELIRVRSGGGDPIIHVGDSGGPLFLPDGTIIGVTSSSACNQLAQFTRTSLFSSWIEGKTATGLACVQGQPTEVGADWSCEPEFYADGAYCDCECGAFDPDCDDPLSIPTCGSASFACNTSGECVQAPATGWHVDPEKYGDGFECNCNSGAPDPDCQITPVSGDCPPGQGCNVQGACSAPDGSPPPGWLCAANAYADGARCDCDCGVLDPDCRLDGDVASTCALDEVCTSRATCEKAAYDCVSAATLRAGDGGRTLNTCERLNSYASACDDDGSEENEDVVVEIVTGVEGVYEIGLRATGFEPVAYWLEQSCEDVSVCETIDFEASAQGDELVSRITTAGPSTRLLVVDGADGCGAVKVELRLVENLCEPSDEICDGVDNNCSGAVDDTGVQLCMPAPPNAFAQECSGQGGCLYACELGFADRDEILENGCEARIGSGGNSTREVCDGLDNNANGQVDETGAAGCAAIPNALASECSPDGACLYECKAGFEDLDGNLANGCEAGDDSALDCATSSGTPASWLLSLFVFGCLMAERRRRRTG